MPTKIIGATLVAGGLLLLVTGSRALAQGQPPAPTIPTPLALEWCLERARQANPMLEMAAASASAAGHRIRPAGALDDPTFSYEASNLPSGDFDFRSTPLSGNQFGLKQKLPFPGLLAKRKQAAIQGAEASEFWVEDQGFLTDSAVESAWAELGFAQRALDITIRNMALLRQLSSTAESRYRVGTGLQQDVLRAQVELTVLLQEQLRRKEAIERAESELAALLDLPISVELPRTTALTMSAEQPDLGILLESLDEQSAGLQSARKRVDEARSRVKVAEFEGLPDVALGLGYRARAKVADDPVNGDDFLSAGITIRLPLDRGKWRARVAEQRALLRRQESRLRGIRAALVARTRRAHAEFVRAASEETLLETGLVPQATQSLASSRAAYQVGRIEFLSLLDSQVRLLGAELQLARARADKRLAFAALESAAGRKLR